MQTNVPLPTDSYAPISDLPPPISIHDQDDLSDYKPLRATPVFHNHGLNSQAATDYISAGLRIPANSLDYSDEQALSCEMLQMALGSTGIGSSSSRAQNGFTNMERLILQAHEQRRQLAAASLAGTSQQQDFGPAYNAAASEFRPSTTARLGSGLQAPVAAPRGREGQTGKRLVNILPSMSEEDFHATAGGLRQGMTPALDTATASTIPEQKSSKLAMDLGSKLSFQRQRNQTHAEARAQAQAEAQAMHTRSTTVPSHYLTSSERSNTQGVLNVHSNTFDTSNRTAMQSTTHASNVPTIHSHSRIDLGSTEKDSTTPRLGTGSTNGLLRSSKENIHDTSGNVARDNTLAPIRDNASSTMAALQSRKTGVSSVHAASTNASQLQTRIDTSVPTRRASALGRGGPSRSHSHDADDEDEGSGLDSPALSYSNSVRTPASLSPATPFSAFGETFEGPPSTAAVGSAAIGKQQVSAAEVGLGVGLVQQKLRAE